MKVGYYFLIGVVCGIAGLASLSHTHTLAHQRVASILQIDQTGPVPTSQMEQLQQFVSDHMGASVAFQLTGAYHRDIAAAQAAAAAQPSGSVYQQAQATCASIKIAVDQAQCNEQYLSTHIQTTPTTTPLPQPQLSSYTYTLAAPQWTPDLTGFLIAASVLSLLITAFKLVMQ